MFSQSIQNVFQIPEMEKKIEQTFLDLQIIAFEFVALNTHFCWKRILVIRCQYVNKQSGLILFQSDQKIW